MTSAVSAASSSGRVVLCAAWTGAVPAPGRHGAPRRRGLPVLVPRRRGDGRGLKVSPRSLSQNLLIQGQIRYRLPETFVLKFKLFQTFKLIALHPAILGTPTKIGLLTHPNRPSRLRNRPP